MNTTCNQNLLVAALALVLTASTTQAQDNSATDGKLTLAPTDATSSGGGGAGDDAEAQAAALAKATLNPVASLISVPIQNNFDWGSGPNDDGFQYKLTVQPVIPISLNENWNVISRTILPYVYQENCVLNFKNKSHSITAEIAVPEQGAEGVIVCQGANIGGWSLYAKDGKLKYCYNWGGLKHFFVESADGLPAGQRQVRLEFAYAGGGLGKGGKATLFVEGKKVGEGEIGATLAMIFSADDGADVGEDSGAPVSPDYGSVGNAFNGEVRGVQLSMADDPNNSDHLVKPEDAIRAALGRQ